MLASVLQAASTFGSPPRGGAIPRERVRKLAAGRRSVRRRRRARARCSHRSAKTPNPDDPIPNFVRGRESTWLTFVLENPPHWAPVIFAMEQS